MALAFLRGIASSLQAREVTHLSRTSVPQWQSRNRQLENQFGTARLRTIRSAPFLALIPRDRAFTSFLTTAAGTGLSVGKWRVPLDV